jgi:low affinity Fe/Cu permease
VNKFFERFACAVSSYSGTPVATAVAFSVVLAWALVGPLFSFSSGWQLVINTGTTIVTFLMAFLIQTSQNRDGAAIQAKLDELLRANEEARNLFIGVDKQPKEEIERLRESR